MKTLGGDDIVAGVEGAPVTGSSSSNCASQGHEEEWYGDEDGAIFFDEEGGGESRRVRTLPEVAVPSAEMVRRHTAAGHCPYRAWCTECVQLSLIHI